MKLPKSFVPKKDLEKKVEEFIDRPTNIDKERLLRIISRKDIKKVLIPQVLHNTLEGGLNWSYIGQDKLMHVYRAVYDFKVEDCSKFRIPLYFYFQDDKNNVDASFMRVGSRDGYCVTSANFYLARLVKNYFSPMIECFEEKKPKPFKGSSSGPVMWAK